MKDKLPKLNSKEAEKLLFENGFILDRQKGSHRIYKKGNKRMVMRENFASKNHKRTF